MAFERPTLSALITRIEGDFVSRLSLTNAVLSLAVVKILARVVAGAVHLLYGFLEYLAKQLFPDLSDDAYLVRQAALYGLSKNPVGYAKAIVVFRGAADTVVPAGTVVVRTSDSARYTTNVETQVDTTEFGDLPDGLYAVVEVTSELAGSDYELALTDELTLETPIDDIDAGYPVVVEVTDTGSDVETTEQLRTRLLERLADPPHGGNEADYIAWAKEVPGVTRVWVKPGFLGPGTVVVYFVRDGDPDPIPDSGEVDDVQAKLDEEAPVTADVTAFAPEDTPINFTITLTPDTTEVRAAVSASLEDLIISEGEPDGTLLLSAFNTAIGTTQGVEDYEITSPVANVTMNTNQVPSLGTITWT